MNKKSLKALFLRFIEVYKDEGISTAFLHGLEFLTKYVPVINFSVYRHWYRQHEPGLKELKLQHLQGDLLSQRPLISIVIPVFNPPLKILGETFDSIANQTYSNWECCLANGDPSNFKVKKFIEDYVHKDNRFKVLHLEKNLGIAGNTNMAITLASGSYVAFLDHDDLIAPFALFEIARRLNFDPDIDLFYSDEDNIDTRGFRYGPFFKPSYSPDYLRSVNYMCHFLVVRKKLGEQVGWLRSGFDGAQDYDFIFRISEQARRIERIPMVLYHWRALQGSTAADSNAKPYAGPAGIRSINEHLQRLNLHGKAETTYMPTWYRVNYDIPNNPMVSVIIPNCDHPEDLKNLIESILQKSTYQNFELVIVENNSREPEIFTLYNHLMSIDQRIRVISWKKPFNYSQVNNWAVRHCRGEILLFLNNDIEIITPTWIEEMLMHAIQSGVGTVGAKLIFPNNTIQHAGVIIGIGDVAGHAYKGFTRDMKGHGGQLQLIHNTAANTAACLMVRQEVYNLVGGFDENYVLSFGDVDLCLKILEAGYVNVWTPYTELYHHESKTRGYERSPTQLARYQNEVLYFKWKWSTFLEKGDPYYNPNLTRKREDFRLA